MLKFSKNIPLKYESIISELGTFEVIFDQELIIQSKSDNSNKVNLNLFLDSFSHLLKIIELLNSRDSDINDPNYGIYECSELISHTEDQSEMDSLQLRNLNLHVIHNNLDLVIQMKDPPNKFHIIESFKVHDSSDFNKNKVFKSIDIDTDELRKLCRFF